MSGRVPPSSRAKSRPALSKRRDVVQAARLYERFSGHQADEVVRVKAPTMPRVVVNIGEVDFIGYTTVRDGVVERYIHRFAKADKPLLVVAPDGSRIIVLGGRYTFTERGIVDASDRKHR